MKMMKQFRFVANLLPVLTVLLIFVAGCHPCTEHKPCIVPNPLIEFSVAPDTFGITPGKVPNVQTVHIAAFDASGTSKGNFNVVPGVRQKMSFDTSAVRPIQLKFTYLSASNDTIAEDSIRINDIAKKGVTLPDMDVVFGHIAPNTQCPNAGAITPAPTVSNEPGSSFKKATFAWTPGDSFEIILTSCTIESTSITKRFRLTPTAASNGDNGGQLSIYTSGGYACSNLDVNDLVKSQTSLSIMSLSDDSNNCTIKAYNDVENHTRTIVIIYPGSCSSISIKK